MIFLAVVFFSGTSLLNILLAHFGTQRNWKTRFAHSQGCSSKAAFTKGNSGIFYVSATKKLVNLAKFATWIKTGK
ncbi:hypothetical protein SAMN05444682_10638 [Parapedobacter indicus]|uniref:Uncharacterized protein n=1 Tax=Parapedobacter indicus TaxID=1477437 RepID=A0A1I3LIY6_9SPHI|nr:hypothetical protein CLV26_106297 [Parapedobacter indicus]SFI84415.1 hypothetical protein SAMN05444682_10638 [Parapedobacter indicus]